VTKKPHLKQKFSLKTWTPLIVIFSSICCIIAMIALAYSQLFTKQRNQNTIKIIEAITDSDHPSPTQKPQNLSYRSYLPNNATNQKFTLQSKKSDSIDL